MWKQILVALVVVSSPWMANAAPKAQTAPVVSYSSPYSGSEMKHQVGVDLSVNPGISLGADYQYMFQENAGVGGYLRFFSKETSNQYRRSHGMLVLGGMVSAHYVMNNWDAFIAPGFGFVNIDSASDPNPKSTFTLGPRAGYGLLYNVNKNIGLGFEHSNYWVWFNADYNGQIISDFALRGRFSF